MLAKEAERRENESGILRFLLWVKFVALCTAHLYEENLTSGRYILCLINDKYDGIIRNNVYLYVVRFHLLVWPQVTIFFSSRSRSIVWASKWSWILEGQQVRNHGRYAWKTSLVKSKNQCQPDFNTKYT